MTLNIEEAKTLVGKVILLEWLDHAGFNNTTTLEKEYPVTMSSYGRVHCVNIMRGHYFLVLVSEDHDSEGKLDSDGSIVLMDDILGYTILDEYATVIV